MTLTEVKKMTNLLKKIMWIKRLVDLPLVVQER